MEKSDFLKKHCKTQYKITKIKVPRDQKSMKNRSKMGWKIDTNLNIFWKRHTNPLEAHFGSILVPTWATLAPTWRQHGASWPQLGRTCSQLGATWGQLGAQVRSKMPPRGGKKGGKKGTKNSLQQDTPKTPPRDDFWTNFGRFWDQFWWIFGPSLVDFWNKFCTFFMFCTCTTTLNHMKSIC